MNLNPKSHSIKLQLLRNLIITLHHYQMFIIAPRFTEKHLFNFCFVIKNKEHSMVAHITYLKPLRDRQSGVKVLAMASMLSARFVRNFVAMINSCSSQSSSRQHPGPSLSDRVRRFQFVFRSS